MSSRTKAAASNHPERRHASVFAALGDRTRLALIGRLSCGERQSISRLTKGSRLTRQAVTKHLRVLEGAGLVMCSRQGREILFEFTPGPMEEAKTYLDEVGRQWEDALGRLKAFIAAHQG